MPDIQCALQETLSAGLEPAASDDAVAHIDGALVPIYVFDAESHAMLAANAAALRLYGYEEAEFLRLSLFDIRPAEDADDIHRLLAGGWPAGLRYSGLWRHRAKNGRVFTVSAMGLAVRFSGRSAVMAIVVDLTQTLRAPGAQAGNSIFPFAEVMDEVCWIRALDDDRLIYANPALERVFGLSREAVYADPSAVERLVPAEDIEAFRDYKAARRQGPARVEYRIRRSDGALRWIASRSYLFEDAAGARLAAGFSEDVTARKTAEQDRIDACVRQRDALVREVHHRIKNSLQGATGLLRHAAAVRPELATALSEVAVRLQSLATVHGLQGRADAGRIGVCDLLRSVAAAAAALPQARIETVIPPEDRPCPAIGEKDAVPVALAVNEIVVNAVKHGTPGATVRLAVDVDRAAATAEIRVVNAGRLPEGVRAGAGAHGSGLQLVATLLPPKGARFDLRAERGTVIALLRLKAPVIRSGG